MTSANARPIDARLLVGERASSSSASGSSCRVVLADGAWLLLHEAERGGVSLLRPHPGNQVQRVVQPLPLAPGTRRKSSAMQRICLRSEGAWDVIAAFAALPLMTLLTFVAPDLGAVVEPSCRRPCSSIA
jgi:hypothetical protein